MSPIQVSADLLRRLPSSVRTAIYTGLVLVGAALSACQVLGVDSLGSLSVSRALEVYAYLAPLTGVVAVANVTQPDVAEEYADLEEPADLSLFQPVGEADDVYGQYAL